MTKDVVENRSKKEEEVQNRTISKKIGCKSAIEHKDGVQNYTINKR